MSSGHPSGGEAFSKKSTSKKSFTLINPSKNAVNISLHNIKDETIIALLKKQDQFGIKALYHRYAPAILGVIIRIVKSEDIAENVLQDTFMKIWNKIDDYQPAKGRFLSWILQIARNAAIDTTRTKTFKKQRQVGPVSQELFNHKDLSTEFSTNHIGIREKIHHLDKKYVQIIELIYFLDYSHSEVAKELNIPLGTVKSRVRKAFKELRNLLA